MLSHIYLTHISSLFMRKIESELKNWRKFCKVRYTEYYVPFETTCNNFVGVVIGANLGRLQTYPRLLHDTESTVPLNHHSQPYCPVISGRIRLPDSQQGLQDNWPTGQWAPPRQAKTLPGLEPLSIATYLITVVSICYWTGIVASYYAHSLI